MLKIVWRNKLNTITICSRLIYWELTGSHIWLLTPLVHEEIFYNTQNESRNADVKSIWLFVSIPEIRVCQNA